MSNADPVLGLQTLLPGIHTSLEGIGFLFGAGTSVEAGYPIMTDLTRAVVATLSADERSLLDTILEANQLQYEETTAFPNIEEIADLVIAYAINTASQQCRELEIKLRSSLVENILSVEKPNIDNHVRFFETLSKRTFGRPFTVWIFTTNYDQLLEIAAAKARVRIDNGFSGCTERYFDPDQFRTVMGTINHQRFTPDSRLTVKLVKLHGSVSWTSDGVHYYERHPDALSVTDSRTMVLPRRKKVTETLNEPYSTMFTYMRQVLGNECKYLLSCGYSFGDEHINQNIIVPALNTGRVRLFTLNEFEPDGIKHMKNIGSFAGGGYSNMIYKGNNTTPTGTDLWKFSNLVQLFCENRQ